MSAHVILAEMRSGLRAYRRRHRHGDQAVEHEVKDTFCADLERQFAALARALGTPEGLTFAPGERVLGRRIVKVVHRSGPRAPRRVAAA